MGAHIQAFGSALHPFIYILYFSELNYLVVMSVLQVGDIYQSLRSNNIESALTMAVPVKSKWIQDSTGFCPSMFSVFLTN